MSLFVCAKCGCVDNTATSSYWMLTNEYMVDKFDYAKELQPYKGMGLCSECGRLATSPDGRDVVVPGKWHGKFPKKKATEEELKRVGERSAHDDEYFSVEDHNSAIVLPKGTIRRLTGRDLKWEDDPISLKSVIEGLPHVDIEFYKQKIINFVKWI